MKLMMLYASENEHPVLVAKMIDNHVVVVDVDCETTFGLEQNSDFHQRGEVHEDHTRHRQ